MRICLPPWVDAETVGMAVAFCAGARRARGEDGSCEAESLAFVDEPRAAGRAPTRVAARFEDARGAARTVDIYLKGDAARGEGHGLALYPRSSAFWIAVGRRLVGLFGGSLDEDDSDLVDWDAKVGPGQSILSEADFDRSDRGMRAVADALWAIEPLAWADLESANQKARSPTKPNERGAAWMPFESAAQAQELGQIAAPATGRRPRGKAL